MSIITSLTRMWLTRSTKPFIFKNEYDNVLSYQEKKSSIYCAQIFAFYFV